MVLAGPPKLGGGGTAAAGLLVPHAAPTAAAAQGQAVTASGVSLPERTASEHGSRPRRASREPLVTTSGNLTLTLTLTLTLNLTLTLILP